MSPTAAMAAGTIHLGRGRACLIGVTVARWAIGAASTVGAGSSITGAGGSSAGAGSSTTTGVSGASSSWPFGWSSVATGSYSGSMNIAESSSELVVAGTQRTFPRIPSQSQSQQGVEIRLMNKVTSGLWLAGP